MADKRESGRIKDVQQRRVLDDSARRRRQRRALDALEEDNFQEDPHADLKMNKRAPKFEESVDTVTRGKKKKNRSDIFKQRFKKNFAALLEEEQSTGSDMPSYLSASVPASKVPERHFCSVCGFPSNYTCVTCGSRYCCIKCLCTHRDTSFQGGEKRVVGVRLYQMFTANKVFEMDGIGDCENFVAASNCSNKYVAFDMASHVKKGS